MKRFYKDVSAVRLDGGWQVMLDGRGVKTPAKSDQLVPSEALAKAMAAEWDKQGEELDPKSLPMRDLADYAIDQVSEQHSAVIEKLLNYAETDTLVHRADPSETVFERQQAMWEPILTAFEAEHGITLNRVTGIMHTALTLETRAVLSEAMSPLGSFELAALEILTALSASLSIGWSALTQPDNAAQLFDAANFEEDIQAEEWGWDQDAEEARAAKSAAFVMAARFAQLSRET